MRTEAVCGAFLLVLVLVLVDVGRRSISFIVPHFIESLRFLKALTVGTLTMWAAEDSKDPPHVD